MTKRKSCTGQEVAFSVGFSAALFGPRFRVWNARPSLTGIGTHDLCFLARFALRFPWHEMEGDGGS